MEVRAAQVGFDAPGADIGQRAAFAVPIEVDGDFELRPDALPCVVGDLASCFERGLAEWDDRNHVRRADAGMHPAVRTQIDALDGGANRTQQRADHVGS